MVIKGLEKEAPLFDRTFLVFFRPSVLFQIVKLLKNFALLL